MSVNSKMTAIADPIRTLMGTTDKLGLDAMANDLETAVAEVDTQATLIQQIKTALEEKAAGVQLPTLNNPGGAEDLAAGKELLDGEGKVITGTYTPPMISVENGVLTIR